MWSDVFVWCLFLWSSLFPCILSIRVSEYPAFNGWLSKFTQFHHFSFWPYMALFIVPHAYKYIFHFSTCDCKTPSGSPLFQSDSPPSMEVNPAASSASLASKADKDRQASNGLVQPATSYSPCSIMEPSCAQSLGLGIIMAMNLELRNDSEGNSTLCHTLSISKWGPSLSTNSRIQQEIWRYCSDISTNCLICRSRTPEWKFQKAIFGPIFPFKPCKYRALVIYVWTYRDIRWIWVNVWMSFILLTQILCWRGDWWLLGPATHVTQTPDGALSCLMEGKGWMVED